MIGDYRHRLKQHWKRVMKYRSSSSLHLATKRHRKPTTGIFMIDPKEPLAPDNDIAEESTLPAPAETELDAAFAEDESEDDE